MEGRELFAVQLCPVRKDREQVIYGRIEGHRESHQDRNVHVGPHDPLGVMEDPVQSQVGLDDAGGNRQREAEQAAQQELEGIGHLKRPRAPERHQGYEKRESLGDQLEGGNHFARYDLEYPGLRLV